MATVTPYLSQFILCWLIISLLLSRWFLLGLQCNMLVTISVVHEACMSSTFTQRPPILHADTGQLHGIISIATNPCAEHIIETTPLQQLQP